MKQKLKKRLYFLVAGYFKALAVQKLRRWNPRIIVITGSSGKTTLLNMIEAQLGSRAKYSHYANSSFGIPFDILGLKRSTLKPREWVWLFIAAPLKILTPFPHQKIYIVEADCDRPGEGKFLASFLCPEVTLWQNVSRTHSFNFDKLVNTKKFKTVEEAIAYEFGYFIESTQKLVVVGDSPLIDKQLNRTKAKIKKISPSLLDSYIVEKQSTTFSIHNKTYTFPVLLPEDSYTALSMTIELLRYLKIDISSFDNFILPPGRSSVFDGIKNTTIIDSSYNASLSSMKAILSMFEKYSGKNKWVVLGDIIELGNEEKDEHEKLASVIARVKYDKIILVGPRLGRHTLPQLKKMGVNKKIIFHFVRPREALDYLEENISGGEVILFKGARFLEGIIEHLLQNKQDIKKLPRRERAWEERRKAWDL